MKVNNKVKDWDFAVGLMAILFGVIFGYMAYSLPRANFGNPMDPLYFPLGIAVVSAVVGVILVLKSKMQNSMNALMSLLEEDDVKKSNRKKVFLTCIISIVYALLFEHLGYVISTFLFMLGILSITNSLKEWKTNVIVAIVFAVVVYFVFSTLLSISLPPLPFEIME